MAEQNKQTGAAKPAGKVRRLTAGTESGNGNFRIRICADKVLEFEAGKATEVPEVILYKNGKGEDREFHTAELINAYVAKDYLTEAK